MRPRLTILLLLLSLLATACGARLNDEQRAVALQGTGPVSDTTLADDGGVVSSGGGVSSTSSSTGDDAPDTAGGGAPASAGAGAESVSDTTGGAGTPVSTGDGDSGQAAAPAADDGGSDPTDDGGGEAPVESGGEPAPAQEQPVDTRAAPAGGNGGATDIGVTEDTIVLGNVSDVSGPVPGIFEPSQLAVKAYIAYFTAREGTIYGRQLQYLPKDGRLDTGANRTASIEVCENAFMAVGSMSAQDQGAAPVIDECGIPDVRAASTTQQMDSVDNAYPASASTHGVEPLGQYHWVAEQYPDAVTKAAFLFICGETTEASTGGLIAGQEAVLGYEYVYTQCIEIQETNYAPFVANMQDRGVQYLAFQGAYQQAARLAQAMRQQGYFPEVYVLQSNAYNQNLLELGGDALEGTLLITSSALLSDVDQVEELALYTQWLEQVAPGERPTGLGMYSWSAAKLTVELLKQIGPEPTRAKMLEALAQVEGWTAGGLHGPQDVAGQYPSTCFNVAQVQNGAYVKAHPQDRIVDCGRDFYHDTR